MQWLVRAAKATAGLAFVLAALSVFVMPGVLRSQALQRVERATGRQLAIGAIAINPLTLSLELSDVSLSEPGQTQRFAAFSHVRMRLSPSSLWRGIPIIAQLRLESPTVNLVRTGPALFNGSDLIQYLMPVPPLSLNDARVTGGRIDFTDATLPSSERHTLQDVELAVPFLTTAPQWVNEPGFLYFSALIDGAPLVIDGQVRGLREATEAKANIHLTHLPLAAFVAYFPASAPLQLLSANASIQGAVTYQAKPDSGPTAAWEGSLILAEIKAVRQQGLYRISLDELALQSRLTLSKPDGLRLTDGALALRNLSIPLGEHDGLSFKRLSIQGAQFAAKEHRVAVTEALFEHGRIHLSRNRVGVFSHDVLQADIQRWLPQLEEWRIGKVAGTDMSVEFTDGSRKEKPVLAVFDMDVAIEHLAGPKSGAIAFTLSAGSGSAGMVDASGTFTAQPLAVDINMDLRGFPLATGNPYLPPAIKMTIADGRLDMHLIASLATRQTRLSGTFGGAARIHSLLLRDRRRGKLLAWDQLNVGGMSGTVLPPAIRIAKLAWVGLEADLVREKNGQLNWMDVAGPGWPAQFHGWPSVNFRLDELVLRPGMLRFTDRAIPGEFHASVSDVDAAMTGLSSAPGKVAKVRVQAVLRKRGRLRLTGALAPQGKRSFAELNVSLDRFDLASATPYSGTYLGLAINRGVLALKSKLRIDQRQFASENQVWVDQLTFGHSVDSEKATMLPVRFLVDLLRNERGDIQRDIPITVSLIDPHPLTRLAEQVAKALVSSP